MHVTPDVLRIIDANMNRAREALRVMEEYARLSLDDAGLSASMKEARHELAVAVQAIEGTLRRDAAGKNTQAEACGPGKATPLTPPLARGEALPQPGREAGAERAGGMPSRGEDAPIASVEPCTSLGSDTSNVPAKRSAQERRDEAGSMLIRSRDINGDVGREVTTPSESVRANASHVALAAGRRLSEALRAVEEFGKTIDPALAAAMERLRYRGYELERRLHITIGARDRLRRVRLYVILSESLCAGDWYATAEGALRGGADAIQLREKELSDRELVDRARRLADLCHAQGALLLVNDRPDVAAVSGADGVHLGQEDMPASGARRMLPPTSIIGISTHNVEQIRSAASETPDYIAVGPMFASETKPQEHIAGPETLLAARRLTSLPLVAIGGIEEGNVSEVLSAAPCIVCVCRAVICRRDVREATARLRRAMEAGGSGE